MKITGRCLLIFGLTLLWTQFFAALPRADAAQGRTLLKANMVRGFVTVFINGRQIGRYGKKGITERSSDALVTRDVSSLVKPGPNSLRAVWSEKLAPIGEIHISFAAQSGPGAAFRQLARVELGAMSKPQGVQSATFNLPDAAGRLANAPGTAGSQGRRAQGASRSSQTLLISNITRGNIVVRINDHTVGKYSSGVVRIDVSNYVRGGANKLNLSWSGRPVGKISVAHAVRKNQFRNIATYDLGVFPKKIDVADMQATFNLPSSAGR